MRYLSVTVLNRPNYCKIKIVKTEQLKGHKTGNIIVLLSAGFLYDVTQNYDNSFHVAGVMFVAGGVICCLLHMPSLQRRTYAHHVKMQQQQQQ